MYAIVLHAHQKIDRVAHRHVRRLIGQAGFFPKLKTIYHFEGNKGPDSIRLKNSDSVEQPWHFIDPNDVQDTALFGLINDHYAALVAALRQRDEVRSGFEASWLAHALVDGLTPAHHYPFEEHLEYLRGDSRHTRKGLVGRIYVKGETRRDSVKRSFELVGPKGLLATHGMFEGGAYSIILPLRLSNALPSAQDIAAFTKLGPTGYFQKLAKEVAAFDMYGRFHKRGWTQKLSRDVKRELAPRMANMVTIAWYGAVQEAARAPQL